MYLCLRKNFFVPVRPTPVLLSITQTYILNLQFMPFVPHNSRHRYGSSLDSTYYCVVCNCKALCTSSFGLSPMHCDARIEMGQQWVQVRSPIHLKEITSSLYQSTLHQTFCDYTNWKNGFSTSKGLGCGSTCVAHIYLFMFFCRLLVQHLVTGKCWPNTVYLFFVSFGSLCQIWYWWRWK